MKTNQVTPAKRFHIAFALAALLINVANAQPGQTETAISFLHTAPSSAPADSLRFMKGGNVSAWNTSDVAKIFADAERLGLDTITVPVRIEMASATTNNVTIDPASLQFARKIISTDTRYRYIIEPYPWVASGNVAETDVDPADKAAWFASWERALVVLSREFPNVWGLYVASNLVRLEDQSAQWVSLVGNLRRGYSGKIIYRTQWWITAAWSSETTAAYRAKLDNPLFGSVDIIAIAGYFELSDTGAPTAEEIKIALRSTTVFNRQQDVYAEVLALNDRWQKPIFFGEFGCPALDFGAQNPWNPAVSEDENPEIQRNLIAAYLETFPRDPSKFLGFSLFTIGHPEETSYQLAPSAAEYVRTFEQQRE